MSVLAAVAVADIAARGSIKDTDVAKLRRNYYADGSISRDEAEALLALNEACPVQDPAWSQCFIEMITDYLVDQAAPEGYLTSENAAWLSERIAKDGKVERKTELELLVNVLDKARWAPQSVVRFALEQVRRAVIEGEGPLRAGAARVEPGRVSRADVELLRRILYAFGGDGNLAITQAEAEILFDINDATADADNDPSWPDLFVKAIANCVMAASGYAVPPREVALRQEAWLDSRGNLSPGAMLANMATGLKTLLGFYRQQDTEEAAIARLARQKIEIVTREPVTAAEAAWLAERIGRDGKLTPNEAALLAVLRAECPSLHPLLRELADKTAAAA
jgi:hypothetical protein